MWRSAQAKNKSSERFARTMTEGPQRVRRRGETLVVPSEAEFERLSSKDGSKMSLGEHVLQRSSLGEVNLERDKSPGRDVGFR